MAAPSQAQTPEQERERSIAGGVLAALAAGGATAASLAPAAAGLAADKKAAEVGTKLGTQAVGELTEKLIGSMLKFQADQGAKAIVSTKAALSQAYPERTAAELDPLAAEEGRRERVFQRKTRERLQRDLPNALVEPDRDQRRVKVQKILDREHRYAKMREDAMHDRAMARAEMLAVKEASPKGAYWQLSPFVRNHTPDCVALAGQFWPWSVVEAVGPPPRHHGCQCQLLTLDEAVERDLMDREQSDVDQKDALARARQGLADAELLEAALSGDEWSAWLEELYEAATMSGGMIALHVEPAAARKIAVDGGEPASELHVTLKFLGDDHSKIAPALKEKIRSAVAGFAAKEKPIDGKTAGPGYFPPRPGGDGEVAIYSKVAIPGVQEFRKRLVDALPAGVMEDSFPDFKPHMTVDYAPPGTDKPDLPQVPETALHFDRVTLTLGGKRSHFELGSGRVQESALPQARYAKGFAHGGEFMPKLGGDPGRRVLAGVKRALASRLAPELPPSGKERMRRGRQVGIAGRGVFVPEGRGFDRTIAGRRYTSPPFSTRVYRDGRLYDAPEPAGAGARAGTLEMPQASPAAEVQGRIGEQHSEATQKVLGALAARSSSVPPLEAGDHHASAAESLNAHGFLELEHKPTGAGSSASYLAPDMGSTLAVKVGHDGKVSEVKWVPGDAKVPARPQTNPPRTWDEFASDADAFARDIARRNGRAGAHVRAIIAMPSTAGELSDHAGEHRFNGDVVLGADVQPSILKAAATRARGAQLTDGQKRDVWKTYQTTAHEGLHAAAPISRRDGLDPRTNLLNEALVEELSHLEAARWLVRTRQDDVAQWRADNPTDNSSLGVYTHYRLALGRALDHAKVAPEDREATIRSLLFDVRPTERWQALARMSAEANGTRTQDEARRLAKATEVEHDDADFVPVLTPNVEPNVGVAEPFKLGGNTVRLGDHVHYSKRVLRKGDQEFTTLTLAGRVTGLSKGEKGWTADVARDGGGVDYAVLPGQIARLDPEAQGERPSRPFGAAADHVRVGGGEVSAGSRVRYRTRQGEVEATVVRVIRDRNPHRPDKPGWIIEAKTAVHSRRVLLTPENTDSSLYPAGRAQPRVNTGGEGSSAFSPAQMTLTVDDRARLGRHFKLPAGAFALPASRLVPARLEQPALVMDARRQLQDPIGGGKLPPLTVHPMSDGRFVVSGNVAALQAGIERGLTRFPVVLGPVAGVDHRLGRASGAVKDGLTRAKEILMQGGGPAEIAREALSRKDVKDRAGFQAGLRAGFHEAEGVQHPSLFGWDMPSLFGQGKKEQAEPWLEKQAKEWAGPGPAKAKEPVKDDAGIVTLKGSAGGSNGARFAEDADGTKWLVKDYKGDQDRVATELLANSLYQELGVPVPKAGTLSFGGKSALAYPLVDGVPGSRKLSIGAPNHELAKGFMADAYLANWDVVGLDHDNVLWPEGTESVSPESPATRLDQGGSLQYRAMGSKKPFGPVPSEVWTMASPNGGQAFGTMALSSEIKKNGAAAIAKLSDSRIEELANAAGFKNAKMRDEVVEALKSRRDWMGKYAAGEVHEPKPAEGKTAAAMLTGGQKNLELFPEQEMALRAWGTGWGDQANAHLRSGAPKEQTSKEVRFLVEQMDSLLGHVRTSDDVVVHASLPARSEPDGGWEQLAGKALKEPGYLGASLSPERAGREGAASVRLTLPSGSKALYVHGVPDLDSDLPAQPEVILARGSRMKVTHVEQVGKRTVVHAVIA